VHYYKRSPPLVGNLPPLLVLTLSGELSTMIAKDITAGSKPVVVICYHCRFTILSSCDNIADPVIVVGL
jgi:hypothetical protein